MRKPAVTNDPLFDRFWAAYPRKVGKPKAQTAFARLNATEQDLDRMLAAIERHTRAYGWNKKEVWKYIPHPATWLNQRRWEDEIVGADSESDTAAAAFGEGCTYIV